MFRRWSLAAATAVATACLLLWPQAASAQVRVAFGAGPIVNRPIYLSPSYIAPSYRTTFLFYQVGLPYNPVVVNPFLYRDPVTPVAYSLTPGVVPGSPAAQGLGSFVRPIGFYGHASFLPPFNYASFGGYGYPAYGYAGYVAPLIDYPGYPSYAYPSFYPGGLPYFSATQLNLSGYTDTMVAAGGAGLTSTPFVPGLTAQVSYLGDVSRAGTTITRPVAKAEEGGEVLYDNSPRRLVATVTPAAPAQAARRVAEGTTK